MSVEFKCFVRGGFPAKARVSFWGGEVDEIELFTLKGLPAPWLTINAYDWSRLSEQAHEVAKRERMDAADREAEDEASYWDDRRDYLRVEGRL